MFIAYHPRITREVQCYIDLGNVLQRVAPLSCLDLSYFWAFHHVGTDGNECRSEKELSGD